MLISSDTGDDPYRQVRFVLSKPPDYIERGEDERLGKPICRIYWDILDNL